MLGVVGFRRWAEEVQSVLIDTSLLELAEQAACSLGERVETCSASPQLSVLRSSVFLGTVCSRICSGLMDDYDLSFREHRGTLGLSPS